ncbi:MAG: hypothetical protein KGS61_18140, partial [Verrucomicrobia bacterium]|nr:hypothetical protein [Verrucomicrobiota bacterium]
DLVIAVTYSQSPTNTVAGQALTSPFSNAIRVAQATLPPLLITSVTLSNANLVLSWINGAPPFQIQTKTNLSDAAWQTVSTLTNQNTAKIPVTGQSTFYRVQGQ